VRLKHELQEARSRIDRLMEDNLTFANKALLPSVGSDNDYCMAGESRLLDAASPDELAHLKTLFGALERKRGFASS
jgi:HrcA protein C terminal domain.